MLTPSDTAESALAKALRDHVPETGAHTCSGIRWTCVARIGTYKQLHVQVSVLAPCT